MSQMTFSGVASLDNGSICMRLTPNTSATPSNRPSYSASAATSTPWVCGLTRNDSVVLQAIVEDNVTVHESRLPMSRDSLRTLMNYVQRQLDMKVGIGEPCCAAADALLRMLEKAKKKPSKLVFMATHTRPSFDAVLEITFGCNSPLCLLLDCSGK